MSIPKRTRRLIQFLENALRKSAQLGPPKGKCSFCCRPHRESGPLAQGPMGDLICFDCAGATLGIIADEIDRLDAASATRDGAGEKQRRNVAILRAAEATHSASMSFPEILAMLNAAGVDCYFVDYCSMKTTYYAGGDAVSCPVSYNDMPPIADGFDVELLTAAMLDSQTKDQSHESFSRRVVEAGVFGYFAFLKGRRVTYLSRSGAQHTEWFPDVRTDT
ncbi:ClpX C4-type zinc finger protein [Lacipirellula limnantheis]